MQDRPQSATLRRFGAGAVLSAMLALAALPPSVARAADDDEWAPGVRMTQAIGRVMGGIRSIADASDYGYDNGVCIMASFLLPGADASFNRSLNKGTKYLIVGGGDDQAKEVEVEILDANGEQVSIDDQDGASPVCLFTVPRTGKYTIHLTLSKAKIGCFCVVGVLRSGGYDVPTKNLVDSTANMLVSCNVLSKSANGDLYFHDDPGQWAMFGTILDRNEEISVTNLKTGRGKRIVVAAGDNNTSKIGLELTDQNGKTIESDEDDEANPQINFDGRGERSTGITIRNLKSRGRALILTSFLKIEE